MITLLAVALKSILILAIGLCLSVIKQLPAYVRHLIIFLTILSLPVVLTISLFTPALSIEPPNTAQLWVNDLELTPLDHNLKNSKSDTKNQNSISLLPMLLILYSVVCTGLLLNWALHVRSAANWIKGTSTIQPNFRRHVLLNFFIRNISLKQCKSDCSPLTWGVNHPTIVVPDGWSTWNLDEQEMVIAHELAHTQRLDSLTSLISGFICCCFWFNPLIWVAHRRLLDEAEKSCDDVVINQGVSTTSYAIQLVTLARKNTLRLAPAMATTSKLSGRINALIDNNTTRKPMNKFYIGLIVTLMFTIILPIGSINAQTKSTVKSTDNVTLMDDKSYKIVVSALDSAKAKQWQKAENILSQLVEGKEDTFNATELARIFNAYGYIYYSQGEYQKSIESYLKIIKNDDGPTGIKTKAQYNLAQLYFVTKNWKEGIKELQDWFKITDTTKPNDYNMLAQVYYQLKNYDESLINIEKAISMTDDESKVKENWWGLQRYLYWLKEDYAKVEEIILTAHKYYPSQKYEKQLTNLRIKLAEEKPI